MRQIFHIPDQGHTLASMLRHKLFENGAEFAACIVPHPQDTFLRIEIEAPNPKECLTTSIHDLILTMKNMTRSIDGVLAHEEAAMDI